MPNDDDDVAAGREDTFPRFLEDSVSFGRDESLRPTRYDAKRTGLRVEDRDAGCFVAFAYGDCEFDVLVTFDARRAQTRGTRVMWLGEAFVASALGS